MTELEDVDVQCECADAECFHPAEPGNAQCARQATHILYRCDLEDHAGTAFCEDCAEDALDSGVFYEYGDEDDDYEEEGSD